MTRHTMVKSANNYVTSSVTKQIRCFTFCLCLLVLAYYYYLAYIVAILTTLERRFGLPPTLLGLIPASFEVGNICSVVLMTFFESSCHQPKRLAARSFLMAITSLLVTLPHFVFGPFSQRAEGATQETRLCSDQSNNSTEGSCVASSLGPFSTEQIVSLALFCGSNFTFALASCSCVIMGVTYIDNNLPKQRSPLYIGVIYSMTSLGPAVAFLSIGVLTDVPADLVELCQRGHEKVVISSGGNDAWAWYSGFFLCAAVFFLLSLPFNCFPRHLNPHVEAPPEEQPNLGALPRNVSELLLKNSIVPAVVLGVAFESFFISGFFTFMMKYIETEFQMAAGRAVIVTTFASALPAGIGTVMGGYLTSRYQLRRSVNAILAVFVITMVTVGLVGLGFLRCPDSSIRPGSDTCSDCDCSFTSFSPVCGSDRKTHYSPCDAGCSDESSFGIFANCSCVKDLQHSATAGLCDNVVMCRSVVYYAVGSFAASMWLFTLQTPLLTLMIRSVEEHQKSLAMGLSSAAASTFSFIPGPILFGFVIDSTCEKKLCNGGICLRYNTDDFAFRFHTLTAALVFCSVPLLFYVFLAARRLERRQLSCPDVMVRSDISIRSNNQVRRPSNHWLGSSTLFLYMHETNL